MITNVPKVAHFYWGEAKLPYLRYLTIETFIRHNPDWKVKLYVPQSLSGVTHSWTTHEQKYEVTAPDFFHKIKMLPVEVIQINSGDYGISHTLSEVHKSDLFRWHLLATEGGLWSDMDIIFFRPVPHLTCDIGMCINETYGHSIGFLFSSGNNAAFDMMFKKAMLNFNAQQYQCAGATMLNATFPSIVAMRNAFPTLSAFNVPMDWVYAYDATMIPDIYQKCTAERFTSSSFGLHWYAGHPMAGHYINTIIPENMLTFSNVLGQALQLAYK